MMFYFLIHTVASADLFTKYPTIGGGFKNEV